jgi:Tol biopolymer transport system component
MRPRAWAAPLAVLVTLPATAATTSGSDSQSLLYTTDGQRGLELRAISPDGTGTRPLVSLAHVRGIYRIALSPDQRTLAAQGDGGISAIRLSDGTTRVVARDAYEFTWSPDSTRIAYRTGSKIPQIKVVRIDGSGDRKLTRASAPNRTWTTYHSLEWAPNGKRIAFVRWQAYDSYHPPVGGRIATIAMSGTETLLPRVRPFVPADLAWSPSGTRLAAGGFRDAGVVIVPLGRGKPRYLRATGCCVGVGPSWSPDGTRLAFLGGDTSSSYAGGVIRIGSKSATVFKQFDGAHDPVWARDSRHFAFVGCFERDEDEAACDIYLSSRDGRDLKRVEGTTGVERLLAWTD